MLPDESQPAEEEDQKRWMMKAVRTNGSSSRSIFRTWIMDAWTEFVDLLKVSLERCASCETLLTV